MAAYEGTDGGVGGKFRKRPFRRSHTTPYDRPPTSLRATQNLNNDTNGWFSKIIDPASKLITAGAHKLFSSFRKRLLPPPPPQQPPDEREEIEDMQPEAVTPVPFGNKEPTIGLGRNASRTPDNNVFAELEDKLKQKTFTRSEIDHLTSLLLSRAVDKSGGPNQGRPEPKISDLLVVDAELEKLSNPPTLPEAISTPVLRTKDIVSSPAEIAKAYMGSRPVRPSSSASGLQNQSPKEDLPPPHDPFVKQISPALSLVRKPAADFGVSSNDLRSPRFRGRSAIYSMARTPYSRPHSVIAIRRGETSSNLSGSSLYRDEKENVQSGRQVLKRRSSILESDIGSVGPIRRIRQKPNLFHPKILSLPPPGGLLAANGPGKHSRGEVPSSVEWRLNQSSSQVSGPSSSSGYVPSQTIETAQKILEQLDKFTPNGKSLETKSDVVVGNTPTETQSVVLDGSPLEATGTVGSLTALQNSQDIKKINGSLGSVSKHSLLNSSSRGEDGSRKKCARPSDNLAHQNGEFRNVASHGENKSKADMVADLLMPESGGEPPQRKRAFQISALEQDFPELDDDVPAYGLFSSTPLSEEKDLDALPKSVAISGVLPRDHSGLKEPESHAIRSATVATTGFTPSLVPSSSPNTKMSTQEVGALKEANNTTSMFNFKSDKLSAFSVPASAASVASTALGTNLETPSSTNDAAAVSNGPDKIDSKSTREVGDIFFKSGDFSSVKSSAEVFLSTGFQTNNTAPSNRFQTSSTVSATDQSSTHASVSPLFLGVTKVANGSAGPTQTSGGNVGTSMFTTVPGSITGLPASTTDLSSTAPSTFSFGGSKFPSTSAATSVTINTSSSKSNDTGFGSSSDIVGVNSSASASSGNSISAFASALDAPGVNAKPTGAASIGVAFGFQTSGTSVSELASTSSLTAFSVSPPTSASSPIFLSDSTPSFLKNGSGLNESTGFTSSVLCSTTQFSSFSSSSSALGSSSPASSVPTSNISSGVFGWNSSAPATLGSTPVPTSASTGFSFGLGSSESSAVANKSPTFAALPSSSSSNNNQTFVFGTSQGSAPSGFSTSVPAVSTPSMSNTLFQSSPFANANSQVLAFGSSPSTNSGQLTMEDSMAEDSVQPSSPAVSPFGAPVSTPAMPAFGAPSTAPSSGFSFTSSAPAATNPFTSTPAAANPFTSSSPAVTNPFTSSTLTGANPFTASTPAAGNPFTASTPVAGNPFTASTPAAGNPFNASTPAAGSSFQFNGQPNPFTPSNTPFQPSGSLEFNGGSANSFSLGTNNGDKSGRKFIKAKRRGTGRR